MAVRSLSSSLAAVRFEARESNGAPPPPRPPPHNPNPPPRLSLTKPSWVVRSESNVHREIRKKPDPPCEVCTGSGRINCHDCRGRGRTNVVDLQMLPKGEWPKWCRTCGGSGLGYCSRCLGTGEYRYIMGFHFMKRDSGNNRDNKSDKSDAQNNQYRRTAADLYEV